MTKLINLDELEVKTERVLTWKGVQHPVKDLSVGEFLKFQSAFNQFSKGFGDDDVEVLTEGARAIFAVCVPSIDSSQVEHMNPAQMLAAVALVANLIPSEEPATEADDGQGDQGKAG